MRREGKGQDEEGGEEIRRDEEGRGRRGREGNKAGGEKTVVQKDDTYPYPLNMSRKKVGVLSGY